MLGRAAEFINGQRIYAWHVAGLLAPGADVPQYRADQLQPGDISSWSEGELKLIIEEGRRQVDRQQADLDRVRTRAQWLLTVAVGALAALGSGLVKSDAPGGLTLIWLAGLLVLVYGIMGAAAVMTVKADFNLIHAANVSRLQPPVDMALAQSYARMMSTGENTVATLLTILRQSVVFCLAGGYAGLVAALLDR